MKKPHESESPLFEVTVERTMIATPNAIFLAWTERLDQWFAAPGTVLMKPEINSPFFFETHFDGQSHPHYGRFLRLVPDRLVELTWVTGQPGTGGAETILRIELVPLESGTELKLTHSGFMDEASRSGHAEAWPLVLALLDQKMTSIPG